MKNNRGLSLIEVIVVIAIMAIAGTAGLGFMVLQSNSKVKECTNKISSSISKVRVDAMSKSKSPDDYTLEVGGEADGRYYIKKHVEGTSDLKDIVGNNNITIKYYDSDNEEYDVKTKPLVLKFDRATGGFVETVEKMDGANPVKKHVVKILVSNGKMEMELKLSPVTGKVETITK